MMDLIASLIMLVLHHVQRIMNTILLNFQHKNNVEGYNLKEEKGHVLFTCIKTQGHHFFCDLAIKIVSFLNATIEIILIYLFHINHFVY